LAGQLRAFGMIDAVLVGPSTASFAGVSSANPGGKDNWRGAPNAGAKVSVVSACANIEPANDTAHIMAVAVKKRNLWGFERIVFHH
jgi:hypothetical protein